MRPGHNHSYTLRSETKEKIKMKPLVEFVPENKEYKAVKFFENYFEGVLKGLFNTNSVTLPYDQINSISLIPPSGVFGFGQIVVNCAMPTMPIKFSKFSLQKAEEAVKLVQSKIDARKGASTPAQAVQQASSADELMKFKQMLDAGIITQDEFDQKKKQLLGL